MRDEEMTSTTHPWLSGAMIGLLMVALPLGALAFTPKSTPPSSNPQAVSSAAPKAPMRARSHAALDLVTNCPYRRAGAQLVLTLRRGIDGLDKGEWSDERASIALEWAHRRSRRLEFALGDLGVHELPVPGMTDFLGNSPVDPHVETKSTLWAASDPIYETHRTIEATIDVVRVMPDHTIALIEDADAVLGDDASLVDPVELDRLVAALQELAKALARVPCSEASCQAKADRTAVLRLLSLVEAYSESRC